MKLTLKNIFGAGLIALAFSFNVQAQSCAVPPTCDALGYTKTASDCSGMSVLKCPFDQSKIFCVTTDEVPGQIGSCGIPEIGDILYSDMSCSSSLIKEKFPIGVIFDANRRLAIALDEEIKAWSTDSRISGEFDYDDGKNNTKTIVDYCKANEKSCPAAEYVSSYVTRGTKAGDWHLPALGELRSIYNYKKTLNPVLKSLSGKPLIEMIGYYYWSSNHIFAMDFINGDTNNKVACISEYGVRPVLAF